MAFDGMVEPIKLNHYPSLKLRFEVVVTKVVTVSECRPESVFVAWGSGTKVQKSLSFICPSPSHHG